KTATITGVHKNGSPVEIVLVSGGTEITVNGAVYDIGAYAGAENLRGLCTAYNSDGALYLPFRAVASAFGCDVAWDEANSAATITR
ncbi:MAG: copper amine oxidase N-terminal domain-containing protein, partial [Clostridiales bacterium]|nr:copper amine oxidase N-terminal domain-containing protein [Clostridiales bacterium]